MLRKSPRTHTARIEVRYAETDAMAVVHHAVYPVWFEQARSEILRKYGIPYTELEATGYQSPVLAIEIEYVKPARYGDFADIQVSMIQEDRLRFRFKYEVFVNGTLITKASTLHLFTCQGKLSRTLPEKFIRAFFPEELS
ncbi:MAG: acyl-CoA thioesterase [Fibrobacter sp.]|jgi:acyl-CoA thioester hydrolase|nr:acyl-CoA thioesterase [Fibrobacter sp.]